MLNRLRACFIANQVFYTRHARDEMRGEELGSICEQEVLETIQSGEILERYPDDEPYPSALIYGLTAAGRPIHVVCAYASDEDDDLAIVITVYEPDPSRWENCRRRKP
jgi:hypothetical protein